jgi:ABC-type uncharacterized transport system fused permease/ATPase subunit
MNYQGKLQGNLFKNAFLKQVSPFVRLILENVAICVVTSGVEATSRHILSRLDIQWRGLLTRRIQKKYFANMVRDPHRAGQSLLTSVSNVSHELCSIFVQASAREGNKKQMCAGSRTRC